MDWRWCSDSMGINLTYMCFGQAPIQFGWMVHRLNGNVFHQVTCSDPSEQVTLALDKLSNSGALCKLKSD